MKYSRLGDTGLVVSRLTLWAMSFGSGEMWGFKFTVDQKSADELVGRAIDGGVNFFDTADVYAFGASEASLRRLNTDYIDLYQLHFDDRITPIDETLRALDNLVRRGTARNVRFSLCRQGSG